MIDDAPAGRLRRFVALAFVFGAACSGDPVVERAPRDAGPPDGGALRDAGARDGGAGPVCGDGVCDLEAGERFVNCPPDCVPIHDCDGQEGCACQSTFVAGEPAFHRDDCVDEDHLCIPWDDLSGRGDEVFLPTQSCVKTCERSSDCGMNDEGDPRVCVAMPLPGVSAQIGKMCVDRVAEIDEYCGPSVNWSIHVTTPDARVKTGDEQVGCPPEAQCVLNVLRTLNPDEGVCLQLCGRPGDDACSSAVPYCNPGALEIGTSTVGVCSAAPLGLGSLCEPFDDYDRAGLTARCDRAAAAPLRCLAIEGVEAGVCVEDCRIGEPCRSTDPNHPVECNVVDPATGAGVCAHGVGSFLDRCEGEGAYDRGRVPLTVEVGTASASVTWCTDRLRFALAPGFLDADGRFLSEGDNCLERTLDPFRCPEPTTCRPTDADTGACLAGCSLLEPPDFCRDVSVVLGFTSTTARCLMTMSSTVVGYCGG